MNASDRFLKSDGRFRAANRLGARNGEPLEILPPRNNSPRFPSERWVAFTAFALALVCAFFTFTKSGCP